jgi:hypothetical protein
MVRAARMREFLCGGRNLDLPGQTDGRRHGLAKLAECPEVALDRLLNVPLGLLTQGSFPS